MFNLDLTRYENKIKFSPDSRSEYDSYLMNVLNTDTKQLLKSACFPISFDGEEIALNTLKDMMIEHYPDLIQEFGHKLDSIEHAASVLLCRLEMEDEDDTYHDAIEMPMLAFRGRSKETNRLLFKMPENVVLFFHKIDGLNDFEKDKAIFKEEENRLKNLYIDDITSKSGVSLKMFKFLTENIQTEDRKEFMLRSFDSISTYLDLCD